MNKYFSKKQNSRMQMTTTSQKASACLTCPISCAGTFALVQPVSLSAINYICIRFYKYESITFVNGCCCGGCNVIIVDVVVGRGQLHFFQVFSLAQPLKYVCNTN